jgi:hypothetical protein
VEVNSILKHFLLFQKLNPPRRDADHPQLFPGMQNRERIEESRVPCRLMHLFSSQQGWEINYEEKTTPGNKNSGNQRDD